MSKSPLKYCEYNIVFQEVPNEVSLVFTISGCPYRCEGCHSSYLQKDIGKNLKNDFENIFNRYKNFISCVCFMGGDQNEKELKYFCDLIHNNNIKTALYTGNDDEGLLVKYNFLDYLKIGHYNKLKGGLDSPFTNQKFFKKLLNGKWEDITYIFRKDKLIENYEKS